jgi:hypothetical protein
VATTNQTVWRPLPSDQWRGAASALLSLRPPQPVASLGSLRPGVEFHVVARLLHVGAPCPAARGQTCQVRRRRVHFNQGFNRVIVPRGGAAAARGRRPAR